MALYLTGFQWLELKYGGKSKAETVRGANARVVEMLRRRA
jgi:hypothetical protein